MGFQPDDAELTPGLILAWRMAIDSERTPEADIRLLGRFNWPWALTVALNEVERLRTAVLQLHQRCDNGHCSCGALRWPCSTARAVGIDEGEES